MKKTIIFIMMVFFSSFAFCQPHTAIQQEQAIKLAKVFATSSQPPMSGNMRKGYAVYLPNENSWIVNFVDQSSTASEDSDYMVRVEATSGKSPRLIPDSQKQRYKSYFQNATNP